MVLGLFWLWRTLIFVFEHTTTDFETHRYVAYSLCIAASFFFDFGRSKLMGQNLQQLDMVRNHALSLARTFAIGGSLLLFLVAFKDQTISRLFLFSFFPVLYASLFLSNRFWPRRIATFFFGGQHGNRPILIGSSRNAAKLGPWLDRKACYGVQSVGIISDEEGPTIGELPVLGSLRETAAVLRERHPTQVILLDLPHSPQEIADLGNLCDKLGIRLLIVNDLEDKLHRSIRFAEDDGVQFISFRQEPLECPFGRVAKRFVDVSIALPVVAFVLPVTTFIVWIFQKLQSPGPLLFLQDRNGRENRVFKILKYRTMHVNHGREAAQATKGDARIYPAGRWFRKLSIDELPQFINVLKGDMSIVGPRPHFVDHDVLFGEIANFYRVRSFIKPGITGLAQVRGLRGEAMKDAGHRGADALRSVLPGELVAGAGHGDYLQDGAAGLVAAEDGLLGVGVLVPEVH